MAKERIKSIVLILLVVTNLVLAEKILVNEKLWLSGYNFFVSTRINKKKNNAFTVKSLSLPENIIVNTGYQSSRFIYRRNSEHFEEIYKTAFDVLKSAFSSSQKNISQVTADDWNSALTAKSIYLNYAASYNSSVFSALLGINDCELSLLGFSNIVIDSSGNVYLECGDEYYRIATNSAEIAGIIQTVTSENPEESVINYSFDLSFDKIFEGQTTALSPMTLIYSEPVSAHILAAENNVFAEGSFNENAVSEILTAFSINKNSARRYTEADGSLVYVENNGILRISQNGLLTFTANENGLKLKGSGNDAVKTANFIDNINSALNIDSDILLAEISLGDTELFKFDYIQNGFPIKYQNSYAISASTRNGYLTSYTQVLRKYYIENEVTSSPDFIESLDKVISKYQASMPEIHINKMFPAFIDDFDLGNKNLDWYIDVDNNIAK